MVPARDQAGHMPVASTLFGWLRLVYEERGFSLPDLHQPFTENIADLLRAQLDWICDEFEAVGEFATELRDCYLVLRRANGLTEPRPELCEGVSCKYCDLRALYRIPNSEYIECQCGALYTEEDYHAWVALVAASVRGRQKENAA